ncbi:hypothetical protein Tco_1384564 [Tanacetum coccineum]
MERELGAGYSFERKPCFVCGSLSHLIKDCDYYEKKMAREAALKSKRVVHADVRQATPAWTNTNRVNKANQFTPRPVQLSNIRPNLSTANKTIKTSRVNNTGHGNVSSGSVHVNSGTQFKSGASRFNTGKSCNSGSVHIIKLKHLEHRGIFCRGCSGHMMVLGPSRRLSKNYPKWALLLLEEVKVVSVGSFLKFLGNNNMYTFDMKMLFLQKHFTCLLAKIVSSDEANILAQEKELVALALKHLGNPVLQQASYQYYPVNTGSDNLNTGFEEVNSGNIEANSPSADHDEEVFSDADDDEMPEIRIYDKSNEGIFEKASYDDELGLLLLMSTNLPDETRSSLKKITAAHALVSHLQAQQRSNHKDHQHCGQSLYGFATKPIELVCYFVNIPSAALDTEGGTPLTRLYSFRETKRISCWFSVSQGQAEQEGISYLKTSMLAEILKKFDLVNVKAANHSHETVAFDKGLSLLISMLQEDLQAYTSRGQPNLGLWYPRESPLDLEAFSDSDYGGSNLDRKSTIGGCQFLGQRLIPGNARNRSIVATSNN